MNNLRNALGELAYRDLIKLIRGVSVIEMHQNLVVNDEYILITKNKPGAETQFEEKYLQLTNNFIDKIIYNYNHHIPVIAYQLFDNINGNTGKVIVRELRSFVISIHGSSDTSTLEVIAYADGEEYRYKIRVSFDDAEDASSKAHKVDSTL